MSTTAPHQAIYRRWRAQTFAEIVGQTAVVETLRNAVRSDRVSHAILFVGPRGTGKTSLARILAKALNCTDLRDGDPCDACPSCAAIREGRAIDLVEIDAASNRGIDAIRDLRERINYAPADLRRKVYILDEAHQITRDAWNALLKSLEEPPDFVAFMFASTHPQEFPPAILSRLQRYDVRRLTVPEIEGKLRRILEAESIEAEPAAIELIARLAAGGMRDAESMLDQLLASAAGSIDEARVRELLGLADAEAVDRLVAALVEADPIDGIAVLEELEERGRDVGVVLDQVVEAVRSQLTASLGPNGDPSRTAGLARVARRLAAIDPERKGLGGLRFQLELALLAGDTVPAPRGDRAASPVPVFAPRAEVSTKPARPPTSPAAPGKASRPRRVEEQAPVGAAAAAPPRTLEPVGERVAAAQTEESAAEHVAATAAPVGAAAQPAAAAEPVGAAAQPAAAAEPVAAASERPPTEPEPAIAVPQASAGEPQPAAASAATDSPPAAEAAPAAVSASDAPSPIDSLRARWPEIVEHISRHPPTKPLIAACRPISVDGNVVTLGFPEGQAFLKDVAERRRANLEEGIGHFLGRPVAVRCVATNLDLVPPVPADEDAAFVLAEARRIFADDLADVGEVS